MSVGTRVRSWMSATGTEILGWTLVIVGIPLMPLPGPGTIVIVAGVTLLARRHAWARRLLDPLRTRAIEAAKYGVQTLPRIGLSVLGMVWLVVAGFIWLQGPNIPEFSIASVGFGPELPGQGPATAIGLWVSAVAAFALLAYSIKRWR